MYGVNITWKTGIHCRLPATHPIESGNQKARHLCFPFRLAQVDGCFAMQSRVVLTNPLSLNFRGDKCKDQPWISEQRALIKRVTWRGGVTANPKGGKRRAKCCLTASFVNLSQGRTSRLIVTPTRTSRLIVTHAVLQSSGPTLLDLGNLLLLFLPSLPSLRATPTSSLPSTQLCSFLGCFSKQWSQALCFGRRPLQHTGKRSCSMLLK